MNLLPNEIKKKIFNFIPIFLKKIVNKESYKKYILSYYPRNINDWKPFTVYDVSKITAHLDESCLFEP